MLYLYFLWISVPVPCIVKRHTIELDKLLSLGCWEYLILRFDVHAYYKGLSSYHSTQHFSLSTKSFLRIQ